MSRQAYAKLLGMLDELKPKHRDAFVLIEVEGLTLKEASAVLGAGTSTLHSRVQSAQKQLVKALDKSDSGTETRSRGRVSSGRKGGGADGPQNPDPNRFENGSKTSSAA